MNTTKDIAKITKVEQIGVLRECCTLLRVELDCDVPGVVFTDGYYTKAPVNYIVICEETSPHVKKNDTIEITSTFFTKGQEYQGYTIKNDCYLRNIKVLFHCPFSIVAGT